MTFIIILIIVIVILVLLNAGSKQHVKSEVLQQGGLRNIFYTLDSILISNNFRFTTDKISSIEYKLNIDQYSYLKFVLRRTINPNEPYEMQMYFIISGEQKDETIRYMISPSFTTERFQERLIRMKKELNFSSSSKSELINHSTIFNTPLINGVYHNKIEGSNKYGEYSVIHTFLNFLPNNRILLSEITELGDVTNNDILSFENEIRNCREALLNIKEEEFPTGMTTYSLSNNLFIAQFYLADRSLNLYKELCGRINGDKLIIDVNERNYFLEESGIIKKNIYKELVFDFHEFPQFKW